MLAHYSLELDCNTYAIIVPEPEAYILQKLLTNPTRLPASKKEKDIMAVRELLTYINKDRTNKIFNELPQKSKKTIISVCKDHYIDLLLV